MKNLGIKKIYAFLLLSLLLSLAACGGDSDEFNNSGSVIGSDNGGIVVDPYGTGFTLGGAKSAGFGMGEDTFDDIKARFGEPESETTTPHSQFTSTYAVYPFGFFTFAGYGEDTPVLDHVNITSSEVSGPYGVRVGDGMRDVAAKIHPDSADKLADAELENIILYGDGESAPTGYYKWLTIEFTSSSTPEKCALVYIAEGNDEYAGSEFMLLFDEQQRLVSYSIRLQNRKL